MATIEISNDELTIQLHGMDKLLALKSKLTIPLRSIHDLTVRPPDAYGKGPIVAYKIAGSYLPEVITAGYFWVSAGLDNNPKRALEHLERAHKEIERLAADDSGRRDKTLEMVAQAMDELRLGAKESNVSLDDPGKGWAFYSVKEPEKTIGFEVEGERVRHVVIELDDLTPEEAVQMIREAKSKGATYRTPG